MGALDTLQTYEALERLSHQMVSAARNLEWDLLVNLERDCRTLVDDLSRQPTNEQNHLRRQEIIRRILADDAEIRDLTEPWMAQSKQFLTSLKLKRKLAQAYDPDCKP